jgi:hypothetical protein
MEISRFLSLPLFTVPFYYIVGSNRQLAHIRPRIQLSLVEAIAEITIGS